MSQFEVSPNLNLLEKGAPVPASLGACGDLLHDVRELRLAMQKQVDAIEARERELKDHIINMVTPTDPGAVGRRYVTKVTTTAVPIIEDWGVFCSWIRKNDRFDMLQKRLSTDAVNAVQNAEKRLLPGLNILNKKDVSITKL